MPRRSVLALLTLILAVSLTVNVIGIRFALPRHYDPTVDAVHPVLSLDAIRTAFSARNAITLKYPRNHFLVVGAVQRVFLWVRHGFRDGERLHDELMATFDANQSDPSGLHDALSPHAPVITELITVGRVVSAIAGTLVVLALFLFANLLLGPAVALIAAALAALSYPLVYYAHTLNIDTMMTCFGMFALFAGVRAAQAGSLRWLFASALLMILAVGTKDYAYGWFLLTAPLLLWSFARPGPLAPATPRRPLPVKGILVVTVAALAIYLVTQGLPFDAGGFRAHTEFLFSPGVDSFRMIDPHSSLGQLKLLRHVGRETAIALGLPLLFVTLIGCVLLIRREPRAALFVFVPVVSFYVTFIAPIGFAFVRFLFPVLLALYVAAAYCCATLLARPKAREFGVVALAIVLAHSAWRTHVLHDILRHDPINAATAWMDEHVPRGAHVLVFSDLVQQSIVPPPQAISYVFKSSTDAPPRDFGVPDYFLISQYEGPMVDVDSPQKVVFDPPRQFTRFGTRLVRVATFGPDRHQPIRWQAAFLPQVFVYRAAAD